MEMIAHRKVHAPKNDGMKTVSRTFIREVIFTRF